MKKLMFISLMALAVACGKSGGGSSTDATPAPLMRGGQNADEGEIVVSRPYFKFGHAFLALGGKGNKPTFSNEKYTSYSIYRDTKFTELNYQSFDKGLRFVSIEGAKVVLGGRDSHSVYDLIKNTADVKKLKITAHTLVIADEIHVAQADVEINAHEIVFEGKGKIDTTPVEKIESPGLKKDGANGLQPGRISILANEVKGHQNFPVILANGGAGQPAGAGVDGARGRNAKIVSGSNYYYFKKTTCSWRGGREGGEHCETEEKKGWRSGNGQDAQVGGQPGIGANGGEIVVSEPILKNVLISNIQGNNGTPDRLRKGGQPGQPARTCTKINDKRKDCKTAQKGADAEAKVMKEQASAGELITTNESPVLDEALYHYNEYAKDLYLERYLEEAEVEFLNIQKLSSAREVSSPALLTALSEGESLVKNIQMRVDYFGNERTWAPKLSFAAAARVFEKEGEKNLSTYFLAKFINRRVEKNELGWASLKNLQDALWADISESREQITEEVTKSSNLAKTVADLNVAQEEFNLELRMLEKEIKRMAKNNLRVPFWEKAVSTISAVSKVVPVGQPTFGAVGAGLDVVTKSMSEKYSVNDFIKDVPSLASSFKGFDWKRANSDLEEKLRSLDPGQFARLTTLEAKMEYLKEVQGFAKPIYDAIENQTNEWREREVSKSALEAEMEKIKRSHKIYQKVLKKLDALLAKKQEFLALAKAMQNTILAKLRSIDTNTVALAYSYDDIQALQGRFKPDFKKVIGALERDSKRRLDFYAYQLAKAYEYQYLVDFPSRVDLGGFYTKVEALFSQGSTRNLNLETLRTLFRAEVSLLVEMILLKSAKRDRLVKTIELNQAEIMALNSGESVYLDFTDLGFFGENKENIRLVSVQMDEGSVYSGSEGGEVIFEHSGESMVMKDGNYYFFTQPRREVARWISLVQSGDIYHSMPSDANGDELRSLLELGDGIDLFSQPAGRTFVKVSTAGIELKTVTVRIQYTFEHSR